MSPSRTTSRRLSRERLIGADYAFPHVPFERAAATIPELSFRETELWGIAPRLDHSARAA